MSFITLPPEITREILLYLPIPSLLSYGLTSKTNHAIQQCSLTTLRLGIFHSRLASMISLMEATASRSMLHSVQLILPKGESTNKEKVMRNQNAKIAHVVSLYGHCLRDLEIACWEFREPAAVAIRELRNLRRLSIRLDHPHTRYGGLQPSFWDEAEGSTVWNLLAGGKGKGGEEEALGGLRVLELERAGVTDYQFGKILEGNKGLKEVRLRKCLGLTDKAFKILAESAVGRELETFHFTRSEGARIDDRVLVWIGKMKGLKSLSLHGCYHIDCELVKKMNEEQWHIADLTLPSTPSSPQQGVEIDPDYK